MCVRAIVWIRTEFIIVHGHLSVSKGCQCMLSERTGPGSPPWTFFLLSEQQSAAIGGSCGCNRNWAFDVIPPLHFPSIVISKTPHAAIFFTHNPHINPRGAVSTKNPRPSARAFVYFMFAWKSETVTSFRPHRTPASIQACNFYFQDFILLAELIQYFLVLFVVC